MKKEERIEYRVLIDGSPCRTTPEPTSSYQDAAGHADHHASYGRDAVIQSRTISTTEWRTEES